MEVDTSSTLGGDEVEVDDLFSDESSFYGQYVSSEISCKLIEVGDDDVKQEFEERAASFDPTQYWNYHERSLQRIAYKNAESMPLKMLKREPQQVQSEISTDPDPTTPTSPPIDLRPKLPAESSESPSARPYNPYEGDPSAKQLAETVEEFLSRLPPSTTTLASTGYPWIWIANPHSTYRPSGPDVAGYRSAGLAMFSEYLDVKHELESKNPTKSSAAINRMLSPTRDRLEQSLIQLAQDKKVTTGKWMLFPAPAKVDEVWAAVCRATLSGQLGSGAKVATDDGGPKPERLVAIYTDDFADTADVARVIRGLHRLHLLPDPKSSNRAIYYKCDAYTYLDINSGNPFNLKASMYNSRDMLREIGELHVP